MRRHWALIVADFRREYRVKPDELAVMGWRDFLMLVKGLSPQARYVQAVGKDGDRITDPDEAQKYLESI